MDLLFEKEETNYEKYDSIWRLSNAFKILLQSEKLTFSPLIRQQLQH